MSAKQSRLTLFFLAFFRDFTLPVAACSRVLWPGALTKSTSCDLFFLFLHPANVGAASKAASDVLVDVISSMHSMLTLLHLSPAFCGLMRLQICGRAQMSQLQVTLANLLHVVNKQFFHSASPAPVPLPM